MPSIALGEENAFPCKIPDMVDVQLMLGQMHLKSGDPSRAFNMFVVAAQSGQPRALNMLGRAYERGWGVERSVLRSLEYFEAAAEGGDGWADFNLADLYLEGADVARDVGRAYEHYLRAARRGVAKALNMLGLLHERGWPSKPDVEGAHLFFRAAAESGDCWGCLNMGRLCLDRYDFEEAARWFENSLPHGFSEYWQALETLLADRSEARFQRVMDEARHRRIVGENPTDRARGALGAG